MKTYEVTINREGKWWMVSIPELGGITQARSVKEAHDMARDYIAITLDVPANSFDVHVVADPAQGASGASLSRTHPNETKGVG